MSAAYTIRDVTFSYNGETVLKVDRLDVEAGEITALIGPNGSGKTTLLHLMAFLEKPETGAVSFFGRTTAEESIVSLRRRVGLLLQQPYLFHTSVLANVMQGLKIRGLPRSECRKRALEALDLVGVAKLKDRSAQSLSGGESQLTALARALAPDPEALLLDEPSGHVDKTGVERTREIVLKLNRERGKTIIFTTHDSLLQSYKPDRTVSLFRGRLVPSVAENLFTGRLERDGKAFNTGSVLLELGEVSRAGAHAVVAADKIDLLTERPTGDTRNVFEGRVTGLAEDGDIVRVQASASGEVFQIILSRPDWDAVGVDLGGRVWIKAHDEGVHILS